MRNNYQQVNDPAFLTRLLASGPDKQTAFRTLVKIMRHPLMAYIKRHVSNEEDAREVLQEGYIGVFQALPAFKGKSRLTTWIYDIIHHKVGDLLSTRSRRYREYAKFKEPQADTGFKIEELSTASEWEVPPDRLFHIHRVMNLIPEAAGRLSDALKEAYKLRDVYGLNSRDASDLLEISKDAERIRIHRARNQIADWVKKSVISAMPENDKFESRLRACG